MYTHLDDNVIHCYVRIKIWYGYQQEKSYPFCMYLTRLPKTHYRPPTQFFAKKKSTRTRRKSICGAHKKKLLSCMSYI